MHGFLVCKVLPQMGKKRPPNKFWILFNNKQADMFRKGVLTFSIKFEMHQERRLAGWISE